MALPYCFVVNAVTWKVCLSLWIPVPDINVFMNWSYRPAFALSLPVFPYINVLQCHLRLCLNVLQYTRPVFKFSFSFVKLVFIVMFVSAQASKSYILHKVAEVQEYKEYYDCF